VTERRRLEDGQGGQSRSRSRMCRNCLVRAANQPRRLCRPCYCLPEVRERVPVLSRSVRGLGFGGCGKLPAEPTQARPGSEEKILVLMARAEQGVALHHPEDCHLHDREVDIAAIIESIREGESDE
jgi:hypothetical protein